MQSEELEVSVVMPCLNEAETIQACIEMAKECIETHGLAAEIVVADNGSTDGSQEISRKCGARVVPVVDKGYGSALRAGIEATRGDYIVMGDADRSYDFSSFYPFIERLRAGADLVMGSRFKGRIMPGAMPWKHKWIGNPVLTGIGRLFFHSPASDFHCGLRAFTKDAYHRMKLVTTGMEFASEMVIKATLAHMRIEEVPITLYKDGRSRPPHLRSWRDGWRHLRFMLLYSPDWLFLLPSLAMLLLGIGGFAVLLPGPKSIGGVVFDVHTLVLCCAAVLVGFQVLTFAVIARAFAISQRLLPAKNRTIGIRLFATLEVSLIIGLVIALAGSILLLVAISSWYRAGFGDLDYARTMRVVLPAITLFALGVQLVFASFFASLLDLGRTSNGETTSE